MVLDKKQYELKDHLGNVRVAIGDMKIPTGTRGIAPFVVDEKAVNDYYPYGMLISDRSWSSGSCRYGYNGKENDKEINAEGNWQDYGMRAYDTRTARFPSVDPLTKSYPYYTPYQFAGNTPIQAIDLDGLEPFYVVGTGQNLETENQEYTIPKLKEGMEKIVTDLNLNQSPINYDFKWNNWNFNTEVGRMQDAFEFAQHVVNNHKKFENISILGDSHGGNVGLMSVPFIRDMLRFKFGEEYANNAKITVVTMSTPLDQASIKVGTEALKSNNFEWYSFNVEGDKMSSKSNTAQGTKNWLDKQNSSNFHQYYMTIDEIKKNDRTNYNQYLSGWYSGTHGWIYYPKLVEAMLLKAKPNSKSKK